MPREVDKTDDTHCLEENDLVDFTQGHLGPSQADAVEAHIDECGDCRQALIELGRLMGGDESIHTSVRLAEASSTAPASDASQLSSQLLRQGDVVERYVILGLAGAGGMGVVYAAHDLDLDRKVALKLLRPDVVLDGARGTEGRARLIREAQTLAKLSHPNILTVYDVGDYHDQVFVAMEFIEGETLRLWLQQKPRSVRDIVEVFLRAGRGLAAAHRGHLVHRDFKPENVLIREDGRVFVTDFGLARARIWPREGKMVCE